jgi:hypothetical protein
MTYDTEKVRPASEPTVVTIKEWAVLYCRVACRNIGARQVAEDQYSVVRAGKLATHCWQQLFSYTSSWQPHNNNS